MCQVCTAFLALSLIEEGYQVWANADASGTFDKVTAEHANARMRAAGVQVVSQFVITTDLMRHWGNTPGAPELLPYYDRYVLMSFDDSCAHAFNRYLTSYGYLARAHFAAVKEGKVLPGQSSGV
jgi:hypothetical protein